MPGRDGNPFLAEAASLGLTLAAALVGFTFFGILLDSWLASSPAFTLTGCLLGLLGGMLHVVLRANRAMSADRRRSAGKSATGPERPGHDTRDAERGAGGDQAGGA